VLGAGMMGAAIAYVCANAGLEVVLKDVSQEAAERGKGYSAKLVEKGPMTSQNGNALLARITPTDDPAAAAGVDLVIEAVFEDPALKTEVFRQIEPHVAAGALLASNTSSLPIGSLATAVSRPADFIGLHFFSQSTRCRCLKSFAASRLGRDPLPRARPRQADSQNADRGQRRARLLHQPRDPDVHRRGDLDAHRGIPPATIEQASSQALPGVGAASQRRAQPRADGEDPQGREGGDGRRGQGMG